MHVYSPWWLDNKNLNFPRGYHIEVWGGMGSPSYGSRNICYSCFIFLYHARRSYSSFDDILRKRCKEFLIGVFFQSIHIKAMPKAINNFQ